MLFVAEDRTEIPRLETEPAGDIGDQGAGAPPDQVVEPAAGPGRGGRRRRPDPASEPSDPDFSSPPPLERTTADTVTERQLVRAFYWLYRGWCRLLGAQVDAQHSDFEDLGKAWLDLARKVPGIRWVIAAAGPLFTLTDLLDKLAIAWSVRTRFRQGFRMPNWRERNQDGREAADVHVVDGSAGAP